MDHIDYYYSAMRHHTVVTHPIKFRINSWDSGSEWMIRYRSIPESSTGTVVALMTIHDDVHKHCNGIIIDHDKRIVARIEPCVGPHESVLQAVTEQWVAQLPMCRDYQVQHVQLQHAKRCVPTVIIYTHQYLNHGTWQLYTDADIDNYFVNTIEKEFPLVHHHNGGRGYHGWGYPTQPGWGYPSRPSYHVPQYHHYQYHHPPRPSRRFPWGGVLLGALGGLLVGGLLSH